MMNSNPNVAHLLMYAAKMDNNISTEEKELILQHLNDAGQLQDFMRQFEKMNEKEQADHVMDIINAADDTEKQSWLQTIHELMQADGRFSGAERYLLGLLKMS